jgi:hypothetical protein
VRRAAAILVEDTAGYDDPLSLRRIGEVAGQVAIAAAEGLWPYSGPVNSLSV